MPPKDYALLGSNRLPPVIELAAGVKLQLGELVEAARKRSKLSPEAWNALDDTMRDAELDAALAELRTTAKKAALVKVKLAKPHTHAGKDYKAGEEIEVPPDTAEWLKVHQVIEGGSSSGR